MEKPVTAEQVREYAYIAFVQPARRRNQRTVKFSSADIHNGMGLKERYPLVCSSIDTDKFSKLANVTLVNREGTDQSNTVSWIFNVE